MHVDIAIGGAGLSGNLQALALARSLGPDCEIAILDPIPRFGGHPNDPRASAISVASRQLLAALGVWDLVAGDAQPIREIRLTDSNLEDAVRPTLLAYENLIETGPTGALEPASHIVPNLRLAAAIQSELAGERNVRRLVAGIEHFERTEGSLRIHAGSDTLNARLLIGADGSRSRLRKLAGIKTVQRAHRQSAIVTTVSHECPHEGIAIQHFLPGGPFAILPMTGNQCCITWSEDERETDRLIAASEETFLEALDQRFGAQLGKLALAGPRVAFPLATRIAREFTADRFALIGDAAHSVHPIAGQGLNLGIRDIAALTECIGDALRAGLDPGDPSALERYSRWRRSDAVSSAAAFAALNRMFSNRFPLLRSFREFGLGVVDSLPDLKQRLVREAAGLSGELPKLLRGELA